MNTFVRFFIRLLPNEFVEELNAVSLDELDERGLIIWASDTTERVVNIIWSKEEWWREGFDTASVFRAKNPNHEQLLTEPSEFIIEAIAVDATPFACPLNKFLHEHGCYSAGDEIYEIDET